MIRQPEYYVIEEDGRKEFNKKLNELGDKWHVRHFTTLILSGTNSSRPIVYIAVMEKEYDN